MSQEIKIDVVQSGSSGTIGRSLNRARDATLMLDSSSRPQPDAFMNPEAFLGSMSSCSVTLIEMHAQDSGIPLKHMAVTVKGTRDLALQPYQAIHMQFKMTGVSQAQAEELVRTYQGRCSIYGTISLAVKITTEVTAVPS